MSQDYTDPKSILTYIEIGILIGTVIWVFAFLRADVNQNKMDIERHDEQIQNQIQRQRTTYVRQDVFTQQYQNILEKLEWIEEKLSATEAMDVLTICNEYFEGQKRDLKLKSVRSYCKIVKDMRDKQKSKADASKEEKVVDNILSKVLK